MGFFLIISVLVLTVKQKTRTLSVGSLRCKSDYFTLTVFLLCVLELALAEVPLLAPHPRVALAVVFLAVVLFAFLELFAILISSFYFLRNFIMCTIFDIILLNNSIFCETRIFGF